MGSSQILCRKVIPQTKLCDRISSLFFFFSRLSHLLFVTARSPFTPPFPPFPLTRRCEAGNVFFPLFFSFFIRTESTLRRGSEVPPLLPFSSCSFVPPATSRGCNDYNMWQFSFFPPFRSGVSQVFHPQ